MVVTSANKQATKRKQFKKRPREEDSTDESKASESRKKSRANVAQSAKAKKAAPITPVVARPRKGVPVSANWKTISMGLNKGTSTKRWKELKAKERREALEKEKTRHSTENDEWSEGEDDSDSDSDSDSADDTGASVAPFSDDEDEDESDHQDNSDDDGGEAEGEEIDPDRPSKMKPKKKKKKKTTTSRDVLNPATTPVSLEPRASAVKQVTKCVAIDCEMVGVGLQGAESVLARVSLVNAHGHVLLDSYVRPKERVVDFRTHVSGVRPVDVKAGISFEEAQRRVAKVIKDRVLVGHAVQHDLQALLLSHPRKDIRDTSEYKPFLTLKNGRTPSLKLLSKELLGVEIQSGEHSSVVDAQATMMLYQRHKKRWERAGVEAALQRKQIRQALADKKAKQ